MLAGAKDASSYIAEMGQESRPLDGDDVEAAVATLVAEIEAEFTMDRLNEFVRCGGFHPDTESDADTHADNELATHDTEEITEDRS